MIKKFVKLRKMIKLKFFSFIFFFAILVSSLLSLYLGSSGSIAFDEWKWENVIFQIRMYRTLTVIFTSETLAIIGLILQTIFSNPLVDSSILGISSGSSLGAVIGLLLVSRMGYSAIFIFSFIFSLLAFIVILFLSKITGYKTISMVLSGVIISTLFNSFLYLLFMTNTILTRVHSVSWMFGTFEFSNSSSFYASFISFLIVFVFLYVKGPRLRQLLYGDDFAIARGADPKNLRREVLIVTSISISLISVYEGPIGFIGLIVPHIARMMLGGDISVASLGSLFISPVILLLSDVVARVLLAPSEIPIGIITSLIGAPFFLMLLVKSYRGE
ncbi:MAG: hypothetical protein C0174_02170 [Thermodesulfobium narugense]|nr:MAG: hypothetical protein C0174_02170 [Thermodesulfobium narugense]